MLTNEGARGTPVGKEFEMRKYHYTIKGHVMGGEFRRPFELGFVKHYQTDSEAIAYATSDDVFLDAEDHEGLPVDDAVVTVRCEEGEHGMMAAFNELNLMVDAEVW